MVTEQTLDNIRILTLNASNRHNPFSFALEISIREALERANNDDRVRAIVVYGGHERSFSAGGDFNEVRLLNNIPDIEKWIDRVIDLYTAVLKVDKPTVAAIDGFAIGMGFQFALMFDQRVMSESATFIMPELKHGIGCSVGAAILSYTHSHNLMQEIIYQCNSLDAETCLYYHLVDEVVEREKLLDDAVSLAQKMAEYPQTAFTNTKRSVNLRFIELLENTRQSSKDVHIASFMARDAQKHFSAILDRVKQEAS